MLLLLSLEDRTGNWKPELATGNSPGYDFGPTWATGSAGCGGGRGASMTVTPGATASALSSAVKRYRLVLCLSIVANLAVGIIILFWPDSFTSFAGQPEAFPKT